MVGMISGRIPALDILEEVDPPSLDDVIGLLHETQTYFRGFHAECEKVDDYYLSLIHI